MRSRFRIEIFDEIKKHDLTLYSEKYVDRSKLNDVVLTNLHRFEGNVRAYVFDTVKNAKVTYLHLPYELVSSLNAKAIT
jgi:hypothetical protein